MPRRFRVKYDPKIHLKERMSGFDRTYIYGCYFPSIGYSIWESGRKVPGMPTDKELEWLDPE